MKRLKSLNYRVMLAKKQLLTLRKPKLNVTLKNFAKSSNSRNRKTLTAIRLSKPNKRPRMLNVPLKKPLKMLKPSVRLMKMLRKQRLKLTLTKLKDSENLPKRKPRTRLTVNPSLLQNPLPPNLSPCFRNKPASPPPLKKM